jgi:hypothetical protein
MDPLVIVAVAFICLPCILLGVLTLVAPHLPDEWDPEVDTGLTAEDVAWLSLDVQACWEDPNRETRA